MMFAITIIASYVNNYLCMDRDMHWLKMPIGPSVNTCISCITCTLFVHGVTFTAFSVIIALNSIIRMTQGTGCVIWRFAIVMQKLNVNALSEFVMLQIQIQIWWIV